jgi:hypothetical protein
VVAQQVARRRLPGERLDELLACPLGRGGIGDVEMDHASPLMRQDHEDEQHLERHRGHGEEVDGDEGLDVIGQEGAPGLRRGLPKAHHVLGHRRLRDHNAQLLQFPVNPRRPPEGVGLGHPSDERSDPRGDGRAAWPVPAALPGPDEPEAAPLPPDHGGGLDDGDSIRPAAP